MNKTWCQAQYQTLKRKDAIRRNPSFVSLLVEEVGRATKWIETARIFEVAVVTLRHPIVLAPTESIKSSFRKIGHYGVNHLCEISAITRRRKSIQSHKHCGYYLPFLRPATTNMLWMVRLGTKTTEISISRALWKTPMICVDSCNPFDTILLLLGYWTIGIM